MTLGVDSLRMPTWLALDTGTRRVILSFSKWITNKYICAPSISCFSMALMYPTPWVG